MKFRVNVYRKDDDDYILQNIKPVYFEYDKSQLVNGSFSHKFSEEALHYEDKTLDRQDTLSLRKSIKMGDTSFWLSNLYRIRLRRISTVLRF